MNTATRDGTELTAQGEQGLFDIRPYWYSDKGGTHSYPMFRDWVEDRPPRGYAIYRRWPTGPGGEWIIERYDNLWDATLGAEIMAEGA